MTELERKAEIKKELARLESIFSAIDPEKRKLVDGLIQNAAFIYVTLQELQKEVTAHGAMIAYVSGNGFETIKDNPAQKAYTTMISRYSAIIDQLQKMLPNDSTAKKDDELLEFLRES